MSNYVIYSGNKVYWPSYGSRTDSPNIIEFYEPTFSKYTPGLAIVNKATQRAFCLNSMKYSYNPPYQFVGPGIYKSPCGSSSYYVDCYNQIQLGLAVEFLQDFGYYLK